MQQSHPYYWGSSNNECILLTCTSPTGRRNWCWFHWFFFECHLSPKHPLILIRCTGSIHQIYNIINTNILGWIILLRRVCSIASCNTLTKESTQVCHHFGSAKPLCTPQSTSSAQLKQAGQRGNEQYIVSIWAAIICWLEIHLHKTPGLQWHGEWEGASKNFMHSCRTKNFYDVTWQ